MNAGKTGDDAQEALARLTEEQRQGEVDAYDGAISYVDEYIGKLMAAIESRGLAENTIVVVVSDHGECFGEHGLYHHRSSLYRELIHVPLLFVWRSHLPEAVRVPAPVSIAALPATLMDLIGASEDTTFPGRSLATHWRNGGIVPDRKDEYPLAELIQFDRLGFYPSREESGHPGRSGQGLCSRQSRLLLS